jgi:ATP-dependent helicase/nuclease subunit A
MTNEAVSQGRVDTVIASAGTGKTYRLVEDIVAAIEGGLAPHRLLATTFTKSAAAELQGRIRAALIERGRPDLAAAMLSARVGTVNAVCGSLIAEFAFELGRSPVTQVIAEESQEAVFGRATGPVIDACGAGISEIAERFAVPARGYVLHERYVRGWQDEVRRAVDLARSNGVPAERLPHCAAFSAAGVLALLPAAAPGETAEVLDAALANALAECARRIEASRAILKGGTLDKDVPIVERALRAITAGERIAWPDWARLAKLGATKTDAAMFAEVKAAAAAHARHPGLRADIESYIQRIFDCAARCLSAFAAYKQARGLLDFTDQEMLALDIISDPANGPRLRELIGAVFVDEFQDSSPIQIAIFTALSQIAGQNLWVGDPKQSIYGFRDADPALTSAASAAIVTATGGATRYLRRSFRTRPSLAKFVNAAIAPNMLRVGMTEDEVKFKDWERGEPPGTPPALSVWSIAGKNKDLRSELLASRIAGLLAEPGAWPVTLKKGGVREARGGDIAVLCRGNKEISRLAAALSAQGVRVAVERAGLLDQPEVEFSLAALRWIADASDTLALAELARLATDDDAWFTAVFDADARASLTAALPLTGALAAIRARAHQLTPLEVFDALLHAPTLLATMLRWGEAEQRLQNLEALRERIKTYQAEQQAERQAVTLTGVCQWIAAQAEAQQPASRHPDAVNIMTYHKAKGLEWPIVILGELDAAAKGSPFGMIAVDAAKPDWREPLAQRVLRFWPWPYGEQQKGVGLDETAPASLEGQAALIDEQLERTRVLYVGLTRPRDHLALTTTGGAQAWLDELTSDDDLPLIKLDLDAVGAGSETFAARAAPEPAEPATPTGAVEYARPETMAALHPPLRIRPSDAVLADGAVVVAETLRLGERIVLVGDPDLQLLGEAIHRYLAVDDGQAARETRLARAQETLMRWGVPQVPADDLVTIADRLRAFTGERFGEAAQLAEWPIHALSGLQVLAGRADLLIDLGDGYAIIDHKSFPGTLQVDGERLCTVAGQLAAYARALKTLTGKMRVEYWIHQPISAVMTRLEF